MNIHMNKEQYAVLIKIIYLGNWMINAIRAENQVKKYDEIESFILSFAKEAGMDTCVHYDPQEKIFYPSEELAESPEIRKYIDEYDNDTFWSELIHRLARRDFIRSCGADAVMKMPVEERIEKEHPFTERYEKEFKKSGVDNLEIKE